MTVRFIKPPAELEARFAGALPDDARIERKRMFGFPAAFVGGHYFAGVVDDKLVIRLPDGLHERLPALKGAAGFDPMGKGVGMKSWFVVPAAVASSAGKLKTLLAAALPLVAALPPKAKKPAKAKTAPKRRRPKS